MYESKCFIDKTRPSQCFARGGVSMVSVLPVMVWLRVLVLIRVVVDTLSVVSPPLVLRVGRSNGVSIGMSIADEATGVGIAPNGGTSGPGPCGTGSGVAVDKLSSALSIFCNRASRSVMKASKSSGSPLSNTTDRNQGCVA